jgi:prepilin-type N-terminal cleavage/methylation domain-containing protein
MKQFFKKAKCGFTIVELLVGMSIFVIIVSIASGIFIRSIKNERRMIVTNEVVDNLNSALELMGREIRGGYNFTPSPSSAGSVTNTSLTFNGPTDATVTYSFGSNSIQRNGVKITSPDIQITNLTFNVMQISNACSPWRITIFIEALPAGSGNDISPIYLQSTISSRVLPKDMPLDYKVENYANCK